MPAKNTRYGKLRNRIRRQFTRSKTYEVELSAGESTRVFDVDDAEAVGNDSFLEHGPFNHVRVTAVDGAATVYTRKNRETYVKTDSSGRAEREATDATGQRYIGFVRASNDDDANPATIRIQVATTVDSEELRLLEMSGLLDIST